MHTCRGRYPRCRRGHCRRWCVERRWQPGALRHPNPQGREWSLRLGSAAGSGKVAAWLQYCARSTQRVQNVPWCYSGGLAAPPHLLKPAITDAASRLGAPGCHEVVLTDVRKHSNKSVYKHPGYAEVKHLREGQTHRGTCSVGGHSMRVDGRRIGKNSHTKNSIM